MAALSEHHGPAGPAAISEANAVGVVVGMAATFLLSATAQTALGWRAALLLTPALTALLALTMGRVWIPGRTRPWRPATGERPAPPGWRFHLAAAVLFCCVALEFSFNLWAAELFAVAHRPERGGGRGHRGDRVPAGLAAGRFGRRVPGLTPGARAALPGRAGWSPRSGWRSSG